MVLWAILLEIDAAYTIANIKSIDLGGVETIPIDRRI
uniref:Uncharacterized protein n=1 Tax=Physcomitrium patens TaxID=3218 RepID=A0A2K1IRX0_PHYPA|nr:hypothetical protein PHYPA_026155 [Physcomitrium patens]